MFKIYDGRDYFYQWDLDRKLIVNDASVTQVHFCNRTDDCSLVCEVYEEDGLYLVNVPNVLLQNDWRINVYAYDVNYTKHSVAYDVRRRSKPDSYVYTETETLNFNTLLNRVNEVDENIEQVVNDYLKDNPLSVDLTGYAKEEYVDKAIAAIPQPDLSKYALKSEIPSTSGLATTKYVDEKFNSIEVPDVDLSNYYTKSQVNDLIPDTSGFALKSEIPSTDGLATLGYVNEKFNSIVVPDVSGFVNEERVMELIEEFGGGTLPASEEGEF